MKKGRQQGKMKAKETARAFNIQKPLAWTSSLTNNEMS